MLTLKSTLHFNWTHALVEVSCKYGFFHPFFRLQRKILEMAHQFFSDFLHKVKDLSSKRLVHRSGQVQTCQEGPKIPKKCPKNEDFRFLTKIFSINVILFYLNVKVLMVFWFSAKSTCQGKIWFSSYSPKSSRPMRM